MGLQKDVLDLLVRLPALDQPMERKAFVMTIGFSSLTVYLDWQGSRAAFAAHLVDHVSRQGRQTMARFLGAIADSDWMGKDLADAARALSRQVEDLDDDQFRHAFGITPSAEANDQARTADAQVLAAALVGEILLPRYQQGEHRFGVQQNTRALQLADDLASLLDAPPADSTALAKMSAQFKAQPETFGTAFVRLLVETLDQNPALAQTLAARLTGAGEEPERSGLADLMAAAQASTARAKLVEAAVGAALLAQIKQKATIDLRSSEVQVGGDFVGGDQIRQGDVITANISGDTHVVAVGTHIVQQVNAQSGRSSPSWVARFEPIMQLVEERPEDPDVATSELRSLVAMLSSELDKGAQASPRKLERWLTTLDDLAPEIADATLDLLAEAADSIPAAVTALVDRLRQAPP